MKWHLRAWSELGRDDLYGILRLRTDVFVVEQNCPYPELDGRDAEALHVWAEDELGVVACARVLPGPVIGRVVTRADVRGKGVGYALMERALAACPPGPVHLSAQAHLEGFYRTFGFAVSGPGYLEDGIPHVPMDAAGTPAARGIDRLSEAERRYRIETADLLFDDGGWDVRQTSTHLRLVAEFFRSQIAKNLIRWDEFPFADTRSREREWALLEAMRSANRFRIPPGVPEPVEGTDPPDTAGACADLLSELPAEAEDRLITHHPAAEGLTVAGTWAFLAAHTDHHRHALRRRALPCVP
jgi:ElaA protein